MKGGGRFVKRNSGNEGRTLLDVCDAACDLVISKVNIEEFLQFEANTLHSQSNSDHEGEEGVLLLVPGVVRETCRSVMLRTVHDEKKNEDNNL